MSDALDPAVLLARAAAWVWVPSDALVRDTADYLLVGYGEWFADPTQCFRLDSERTAADLVDDVLDRARAWGRPWVTFSGLHDHTRPADLEAHLQARGATLVEQYAVLALDLRGSLPDVAPPADVEVREVVDLATRRDLDRVDVAVFGGEALDDDALIAGLERDRRDGLDAPRFVAYRSGSPVGGAGCTLVGDTPGTVDTVRLWGGGVLAPHRGRGVYRALLAHRLRLATARGAEVALVKARVETSAPVLLRTGFSRLGEERCWRLATTGDAASRTPGA
ncbi:GNAT family N-acetyltransferase [Nocardioides perillae]|uniref:GNAT superfamily N-acetyltransferase n=1 Tax=Nocardioides perillae TaxID=1119534 RepID=A0A7Y9RTC1_9ACTN|nr:GNAT family N-acetyltransferase [Nocardioides perillae]NYG54886.1 GNAT superfamily N-acetyltransferase [Nocardioides perillae]